MKCLLNFRRVICESSLKFPSERNTVASLTIISENINFASFALVSENHSFTLGALMRENSNVASIPIVREETTLHQLLLYEAFYCRKKYFEENKHSFNNPNQLKMQKSAEVKVSEIHSVIAQEIYY